MTSSGNKQYDNGAFSGYGLVLGHLMRYEYSSDPLDLLAALRAGHWLLMKNDGLATYYKSGVWWSAYQGQAFIDLYQATNDQKWMDAAIRYARRLESWQYDNGAWSWYDEHLDIVGHSFLRSDRSNDHRLLAMPEFLYFLGSMRAAGNYDFTQVEEAAIAWHRSAINDGSLDWHTRRSPYPLGHPNIKLGEDNIEANPIMTYLRYLIEFRTDATEQEIDQMIGVLQDENLIQMNGEFAPAIIGYEPRHKSDHDAPAAMTTTTAQFATLNLMRKQRFNTTNGPNAEACIAAILRVQEPDTGMIDHLGRNLLGHDSGNIQRMREDMHPYVGLKAIALRELIRARTLLGPPADDGEPIADAGPNQTVWDQDDSGNEVITLDASESTDDGTSLAMIGRGQAAAKIPARPLPKSR